jgi:predicted outer membrane lipoprotein
VNALVASGPIRAATFFALAFGLTVVGGLAIGELRSGIRLGLRLGAAFGILAYLFLRPTEATATDE